MSNKPKPGAHPEFIERRNNGPIGQMNRPGSAGAPAGYSEAVTLMKALQEKSQKCFGGRIFTSMNHAGFPIVCHAVANNLLGDKTEEVSHWYHLTNAKSDGIFLHYEGSLDIGDWTCFKFTLLEGASSMREMMGNPERKGLCRNLFANLVTLLHNYSEEFDGDYAPLCSISPDTVYYNPNGRIRLLPLFGVNNEYPRGFPLEAGTEEMDDTTDLYTAALLTHQVLSGFEYEKLSEHKRMLTLEEPACMADCLSLFASQRPTLKEVYNILTKGTSPESEPKSHNKRKPVPKDIEGNDLEKPARTGEGKNIFSAWRRNLTSFFSMESPVETSRTAGRPVPKRKPMQNFFAGFPDEDEEDDYDEDGYGVEQEYDDYEDA